MIYTIAPMHSQQKKHLSNQRVEVTRNLLESSEVGLELAREAHA